MKWRRGESSEDVIDARGEGGSRGGMLPIGGGVGLVGILIFFAVQLLGGGGGGGGAGGGGGGFKIPVGFEAQTRAPSAQPLPAGQDPERDLRDFSAYVFDDTQAMWKKTFAAQRIDYSNAKVVFYRDAVNTGCGSASSAVGPFYCPADMRVYLDFSFYRQMQSQLGASGDFAWAYVIAHEMGHHVQQELGATQRVEQIRRSQPDRSNDASVRLELQADCYAGVWAKSVFEQLEEGDIEEAMAAAEAVGDDRLQGRGGGDINPDSFTHGSSAQRRGWFDRGRARGEPADCDTFSAQRL